jgi:hypothetical protein
VVVAVPFAEGGSLGAAKCNEDGSSFDIPSSISWVRYSGFSRGLPEDEIPLQCGFPVIRFVALLSLNSGAILKIMMDGLRSRYWKGRPRHYRNLNYGPFGTGRFTKLTLNSRKRDARHGFSWTDSRRIFQPR